MTFKIGYLDLFNPLLFGVLEFKHFAFSKDSKNQDSNLRPSAAKSAVLHTEQRIKSKLNESLSGASLPNALL